MPTGNDLPQHYRFAISFYDALRAGDIYPVWISKTNLGYGDAGVRFYPPVAYYLVAFFRVVVPSWNAAIASAVCYWFLVSGMGVFLLSREWFSEKASLVAALVFMAMPYHVNQVYNAGLFAEFAGLAILPFCFLFVKRITSGGGIDAVASLSISYALLILSHLPLAIIGSAALLIFSVPLIRNAGWNVGTIGKLVASVGLAAAASAFYWIRLVTELEFVKHTLPQFTAQAYDFRLNFLASLLYVPAEQYEQTSLWFTDILFLITLAMVVPSLAFCLRSRPDFNRRTLIPVIAIFTFAIIIGTPISRVLWEHVGLLQKIQFPWRLLGLLSLAGAIFVAGFVEQLQSVFKGKLRPLGLITVGLLFAGFVFTFAQVIRPAGYPDSVASFDNNFEVYQYNDSNECWWPAWARREAFKDLGSVSRTHRNFTFVEAAREEKEISLGNGPEEKIRIAAFYYPFWNATSSGKRLNVEPADDGTILITVPAGPQNVRVFFEQPASETFARGVSLVTWILLLLSLIVTRIKVRRIS